MKPKRNKTGNGFTLVELLVAASLGAIAITAAVIGFIVISSNATRGGRVDVRLPEEVQNLFYGSADEYVTMWPNPNYAEAARARLLRERLLEDVQSACAVFCLGRNEHNGVRLSTINFDAGTDMREVTTPAAFLQFLVDAGAVAENIFSAEQNGVLNTANASIFVVGGLATQENTAGATNALQVLATYEVDFVATTDPVGIYASVRRYSPESLNVPTDFYHAFYPGEDNGVDGFRPLSVFFGRTGSGQGYDIAPNHPFAMIWWPDPLISALGGSMVPSAVDPQAGPRSAYSNMAGRTSLFTVLPIFPGQ